MSRRLVGFALLALVALAAACGSDPPPPVVVVPPQPPLPPADVATSPPPPAPLSVAKPEEPASGAESPLEQALREWTDATTCKSYDYHPNGGIQSFWCHRPTRITVPAIATLAGVDIFKSGPHKNNDLALDSANEFGHYNPGFVRWLIDKVPPSPRDSAVQKATQASYDKHVKPLAEIFYYTLEKAKSDPDCFNREKTAYADLIAKNRLPKDYYERWFYWMNSNFCAKAKSGIGADNGFKYFYANGFDAGLSGNVTKTVTGFWMRRAIDGTMDSFAEGLKKMLASYEPTLLGKKWTPPPPAQRKRP